MYSAEKDKKEGRQERRVGPQVIDIGSIVSQKLSAMRKMQEQTAAAAAMVGPDYGYGYGHHLTSQVNCVPLLSDIFISHCKGTSSLLPLRKIFHAILVWANSFPFIFIFPSFSFILQNIDKLT
jgi:hypothetical protein